MGEAEKMESNIWKTECTQRAYVWTGCFSCNLRHSVEHSVVLRLTGHCSRSAFDEKFHIKQDESGFVIYLGFDGTIIKYYEQARIWNMTVLHKQYAYAFSKAAFETLILGNHDWDVHNDVNCYNGIEVKK